MHDLDLSQAFDGVDRTDLLATLQRQRWTRIFKICWLPCTREAATASVRMVLSACGINQGDQTGLQALHHLVLDAHRHPVQRAHDAHKKS